MILNAWYPEPEVDWWHPEIIVQGTLIYLGKCRFQDLVGKLSGKWCR